MLDIGRQAYVHKLLTGRRENFGSLPQADGLSGYTSRAESVHDWVERSHAATALSYAGGSVQCLPRPAAGPVADDRDHRPVAQFVQGAGLGPLRLVEENAMAAGGDRR